MIIGCSGLTFLLIFNILFILKSIGIVIKLNKNDEIYENLKNLKSLDKLNFKFISRIKNFDKNFIKNIFIIKLKLLNNVIKKIENFIEFVFHHFYFFTILMMVLFHGISTFSNSFIIEVRNRETLFFFVLFFHFISPFSPFLLFYSIFFFFFFFFDLFAKQ